MSFTQAQAFAASLASTLMAVIIIFRAGDGTLSVVPSSEFDGDADVVAEIDPFAMWPERPNAGSDGSLEFHSRHRQFLVMLQVAPRWWWMARPLDTISRKPPP